LLGLLDGVMAEKDPLYSPLNFKMNAYHDVRVSE
jgi:hypothetical protein